MPVRNVATPDSGRPSTVISLTLPSGFRRMRSAPVTERPSMRPSQKNAWVSPPSNSSTIRSSSNDSRTLR